MICGLHAAIGALPNRDTSTQQAYRADHPNGHCNNTKALGSARSPERGAVRLLDLVILQPNPGAPSGLHHPVVAR